MDLPQARCCGRDRGSGLQSYKERRWPSWASIIMQKPAYGSFLSLGYHGFLLRRWALLVPLDAPDDFFVVGGSAAAIAGATVAL